MAENADDTAPLLLDPDPEDSAPLIDGLETPVVALDLDNNDNDAPPPYTDAPPPYDEQNSPNVSYTPNTMQTQAQTVGVMGEPTVVCRVCQQLVFIRGREGQRVVKCSNCHEATPIKAPPTGKKYIRCPCNALLTCRATSSRISCPRANCKRVINVGGGGPPVAPPNASPPTPTGDKRIRVTCGHCNETFVFRTTAHLARCPYCRKVSSVGPQFAKKRAIIFAVIGILFLGIGVGVTVGTYKIARESGGIYVTWFAAYIVGILNLMRCCYYCMMTVSQVESEIDEDATA
jgi:phosphatidylinositol-4,5-bisphosphate 4-phosphatase